MPSTRSALLCLVGTAIALSASAAHPTWRDLENYTFEKFISDFHLQYSESEQPRRRELFRQELARVVNHNSKSGASWKEGINKFSAMDREERKSFRGWSKNHMRAQKGQLKHLDELEMNVSPVEALPTKVDWREKGVVSAVKDQGHCGSCWAFAATETIESHVAISTGLLFVLSTEQVAMCTPNPNSCGGTGGCEGATSELAFDYVSSSRGLQQEFSYPYTSYYGEEGDCSLTSMRDPVATIGGFATIQSNNYTSLMNAVAKLGPVAVTVDASTWHAYEGGVYDGCDQETPDINHGVVLVGYGEEESGEMYWLVRNSWSPTWGESGYIKLKRTDTESENCGTDVTPADGIACAGDDETPKVCGTCGVLFDSSLPLRASLV